MAVWGEQRGAAGCCRLAFAQLAKGRPRRLPAQTPRHLPPPSTIYHPRLVFNPDDISPSAYHTAGLITSTTDPLNNPTTYGYDADGNKTSVTDPLGHATTSTYDAQGRTLTVTDANGGVTTYKYDLTGNLVSLTDPDNNTTSYSYNAVNELVSTINPLGYQSTDAYDAAGELISATDADGRTINYGYNAVGERTSETWVGGNYTATYQYDAAGQLTSASDPYSTYTYTYDAAGRQTSVSNAGTPGVPAVTLTNGYDAYGDRTSLTDSLGGSISYTYDGDLRLTGIQLTVNTAVAAQLSFGYDAASNMTGIGRTAPSVSGDTITSSYSYDAANRLTNITDTDSTKALSLASYSYGYDKASELTSYQDNNSSLTYGYDKAGQWLSASGTLAGQSYNVGYQYDANGNRSLPNYQTGKGNELLTDGTYNYTYDKNGNTLTQTDIATGTVIYFTWDYRNRLVEEKVEDSHGNVLNDEKFTYDVNDYRIGVSLNGVQQSWTVYDGANPYMDFTGSGQLTQRYLTNPSALNQFYGQVSGSGTTEWFLTDLVNSIRQVISVSGTSLDAIPYDPFGNIVYQTNANNAPRFLYTGAPEDPLTTNYQDGRRQESSLDGRWESPDPTGFAAGDTNLYRYVFNAPLAFTDPSGLQLWHRPGNSIFGGPPYLLYPYRCNLGQIPGYHGSFRGPPPIYGWQGQTPHFEDPIIIRLHHRFFPPIWLQPGIPGTPDPYGYGIGGGISLFPGGRRLIGPLPPVP